MPVAEAVGDGGLGEGQAEMRIRFAGGAGVQLMAEALLVTTGHRPGAGGAANRTGDVAAWEADAVAGERVDVRRREFAFASGADAGVAEGRRRNPRPGCRERFYDSFPRMNLPVRQ